MATKGKAIKFVKYRNDGTIWAKGQTINDSPMPRCVSTRIGTSVKVLRGDTQHCFVFHQPHLLSQVILPQLQKANHSFPSR